MAYLHATPPTQNSVTVFPGVGRVSWHALHSCVFALYCSRDDGSLGWVSAVLACGVVCVNDVCCVGCVLALLSTLVILRTMLLINQSC